MVIHLLQEDLLYGLPFLSDFVMRLFISPTFSGRCAYEHPDRFTRARYFRPVFVLSSCNPDSLADVIGGDYWRHHRRQFQWGNTTAMLKRLAYGM